MRWLRDNFEALFLVAFLAALALFSSCATARPNVTSYMKAEEQAAELAAERCLERYLVMSMGKSFDIDVELKLMGSSKDYHDKNEWSYETVDLLSKFCMTLFKSNLSLPSEEN